MSFFFTDLPASTTSELLKPVEQTDSESGNITRRFSGVSYWRGSIDFPPPRDEDEGRTLLAEMEKASTSGGSFYADLNQGDGKIHPTPLWMRVVADDQNGPKGFAVPRNNSTTPFEAGTIVSFRRYIAGSADQIADAYSHVTARITTARTISGSNYRYALETPLSQEFAPEAGAVIEVCFNRPHVRAKLRADAIQWTTQPRLNTPASVEWFEDVGANMAFLHTALFSPTGYPTNPPPLNSYLVSEDGSSYITGEDGTYIVSED